MNIQSVIIKEIVKRCGKTNKVFPLGWHFVHKDLHYFYFLDKNYKYIRMTIPHIMKVELDNMNEVKVAVNSTNRELRFIKAVILNNGSVSICYDHKITKNENIAEVVSHIIKTLDFASNHLKKKISGKSI